jgi:GDP-L-fucose synthase
MLRTRKIYIAGHRGMVGSAIRSSSALDLRDQAAVMSFFENERPEVVLDSAARVGGILANQNYPYQFLMENMQIQNNLIAASLKYDVRKFIFLGSSCIYPKFAPQPLKEEYLMTGPLEETNEWYAIAKISGVKACEAIRKQFGKDYISLMPTNLYGPRDNFDLQTSHVVPAMIRKFHEAKLKNHHPVIFWGSGTPMREFLHVDDLAESVVFSMERNMEEGLYNVGTGVDLSIKSLAELIQKVIGHTGEIIWDSDKPDGTPRKLMDVSKMIVAGWKARISLEDGIEMTYNWFLKNTENYKEVKL